MDLRLNMVLVVLYLLGDFRASSEPVSCISCVWSNSEPNAEYNPCYSNPSNSTKTRCRHSRFYCQTVMVHYDGGATVIQRGCVDPLKDVDQTTSNTPLHDRCIVMADPTNRRLETKCYHACRSNFCNNVTVEDVKLCPGDCSIGQKAGRCNYATGRCECNDDWLGRNCEIAANSLRPSRSCVQCNSKTDPNCFTATHATLCPSNVDTLSYCATTRTTVFDKDERELDSYVSRGCSATHSHSDECQFFPYTADSLPLGAVEYTCTSTCKHDGCNTNLPDGLVTGKEKKDLHCLVCESDSDDSECAIGDLPRTRCPPNTHYCKATVTYYLSEKNDLQYQAEPEYRFEKIVRKCGGHSSVSRCRSRRLGPFQAKKVKCEETCQKDGCNRGWPARPMCAQCSSNYSQSGNDNCWSNPSWPTQCSKPYKAYCVATDYQPKSGKPLDGFRRRIDRKCSYHSAGKACSIFRYGDIEVETCNRTCTTTGCNLGIRIIEVTGNNSSMPSCNRILLLFLLLVKLFLQLL